MFYVELELGMGMCKRNPYKTMQFYVRLFIQVSETSSERDRDASPEIPFMVQSLHAEGVGMQWWGSTVLNWVWACRGWVRHPLTGCGHAVVGFDSL